MAFVLIDLYFFPLPSPCRQLYTVAAHKSLVSKVRYAQWAAGPVLLTASYDKSVKLWSADSGANAALLTCLEGHEGRVMGADLMPATGHVVSVAYDRTIKIWKMDMDSFDGDAMEVE